MMKLNGMFCKLVNFVVRFGLVVLFVMVVMVNVRFVGVDLLFVMFW